MRPGDRRRTPRLAAALLLGALLLGACRAERKPEQGFGALPLVIYSSRPEPLLRFLVDEYRDRAGLPIRLHRGEAAELLARLAAEDEAPEADLLWLGAGELPHASRLAEAIPPPPGIAAEAAALLEGLALVRGAPNAGAARAFAAFLASPETARAVAAWEARE